MHFLLGNFFWRGVTSPATAMTVSTQPGVHGIIGVCVCVCVWRIGVVVSVVDGRINEVKQYRAQLVHDGCPGYG